MLHKKHIFSMFFVLCVAPIGAAIAQLPAYTVVGIPTATAEGCSFPRVALQYTDPEYAAKMKPYQEQLDKKMYGDSVFSWSGKCAAGSISGLGELTQKKSNGAQIKRWLNAEPGKLPDVEFGYDREQNSASYIAQKEVTGADKTKQLSPQECLTLPKCKALHDARIMATSAEQVALEDQLVIQTLEMNAIRMAKNEALIKANAEASRKMAARIDEEEAKRPNILSAVGAIAQGVGNAGGRNSAQLKAVGSALQNASGGQNTSESSIFETSGLPAQQGTDSNFLYDNNTGVNQCVKIVISQSSPRRYHADNECGFKINAHLCTIGSPIGGNCGPNEIGDRHLEPNRTIKTSGYFTDSQSGAYEGGTFKVIACRDPFFPYVTGWNGRDFNMIQCRAYKKR